MTVIDSDPPKTNKWTLRKIIAIGAAGIFITCCGLTSLGLLLTDSDEPEATAVSQQDRAVEIALENEEEPNPSATRRPTNTPRPTATATTEPTVEPTATETEQPKEAIATRTATNTVTPQPTNTAVPQPTNTTAPQPTNTTAPQPTATQPPPPTAPPAPTATQPPPPPTEAPAAAPGVVQISFILYDGAVSQVESDEYAVIINNGGSPINIGGWRLNAGAPGQDFAFPGFDLQPGQSCRLHWRMKQLLHSGK